MPKSSDSNSPTANVSLPVLGNSNAPTGRRVGKSRMGKWRALVLAGVHVLIIAHIVHWLIAGRTISPVEPSESMETIEQGVVNAGAIFFGVAILSTLIFGRFFCGWGCHVVALQDLCGWLMKKCGIRPKPFRSRLLPLIPLILAFYMFAWPTVLKLGVEPALDAWWPAARAALGPIPGLPREVENGLVKEDFWATFPTIAVAIPFLFVCGFATVYFLGAKGFCTYGCPYGGVFGPVDLASPGRIVVDHDKCAGCAHCTAVCTSNVRVHEEIREYGMVVDPGCMKCMDCVSVCPNDALSFRLRRPSLLKGRPRNARPKRKFDTTILEDLGLGLVFLITFYVSRGTYPVVPMLFAVGIAGCCTFIAWKAYRLIRDPNVRMPPFQLRLRGRFTAAGLAFAAAALLLTALTAHTAYVKHHNKQGQRIADQLTLDKNRLLSTAPRTFSAAEYDAAKKALGHFSRAASFKHGGVGLMDHPTARMDTALLSLALGDDDTAEAYLRRNIERQGPTDDACVDLGLLLISQGRRDEAIALWNDWLEEHPELWLVRDHLSNAHRLTGTVDDAIDECRRAIDQLADRRGLTEERRRIRLQLARMLAWRGEIDEALDHYAACLDEAPESPAIRDEYCRVLAESGRLDDAISRVERDLTAVKRHATRNAATLTLARLLAMNGEMDRSLEMFESVMEEEPRNTAALREYVRVVLPRNPGQAITATEHAVERIGTRYRYRAHRADALRLLADLEEQTGDADAAANHRREALAATPDNDAIARELVATLLRLGRPDDAVTAASAATAEATNEITRRRMQSVLLMTLLQTDNRDAATSLIDALLAERPDDFEAITARVRMLVASGDIDGALVELAGQIDAIDLSPVTAPGLADLHVQRARLMVETGRRSDATDELQAAVDLQPHVALYRMMLGEMLGLIKQDAAGAADAFEMAARLDAMAVEPWYWVGHWKLRRADDAGAQDAFQKAINLSPGDPRLRQRIAATYRDIGRAAPTFQ